MILLSKIIFFKNGIDFSIDFIKILKFINYDTYKV